MYDKLSIINTALLRTGNNIVQFEGDGSDEWNVGSDAYETEVANLIAMHDWGFATSTAALARIGSSPNPRFTDAFARPIGCLQVSDIWLNGSGCVYDVVGNQVVLNSYGVTPVAKFVAAPTNNQWPPLFIEALRLRVMSHIYRGLNEDNGEADKLYAASEKMVGSAQARSDQEVPARAMLVSRLRAARHRRRGGLGMAYSTNMLTPRG